MSIFNREYITLDNLSEEQLENVLAYLDRNDQTIFGLTGRRYIQVDVRYSRFIGAMRFKLTIPKSWVKRLSEAATLDMIRQGVV